MLPMSFGKMIYESNEKKNWVQENDVSKKIKDWYL